MPGADRTGEAAGPFESAAERQGGRLDRNGKRSKFEPVLLFKSVAFEESEEVDVI